MYKRDEKWMQQIRNDLGKAVGGVAYVSGSLMLMEKHRVATSKISRAEFLPFRKEVKSRLRELGKIVDAAIAGRPVF